MLGQSPRRGQSGFNCFLKLRPESVAPLDLELLLHSLGSSPQKTPCQGRLFQGRWKGELAALQTKLAIPSLKSYLQPPNPAPSPVLHLAKYSISALIGYSPALCHYEWWWQRQQGLLCDLMAKHRAELPTRDGRLSGQNLSVYLNSVIS